MAVDILYLIEPVGPIQHAMFPGDARGAENEPGTLEYRVTAYRDDGVAKVAGVMAANPGIALDEDGAVAAWAKYRAFEARYIALSTQPATVSVTDQGGKGFLGSQIQAFADKMGEALGEFNGIVSAARATKTGRGADPRQGGAVKVSVGLF